MREELGLPGGLHEAARPLAYQELAVGSPALRALWGASEESGSGATVAAAETAAAALAAPAPAPAPPPPAPPLSPLVIAASRGNADAVQLLLLFGEARRRGIHEAALLAACEQGNLLSVAALLGRVPLRPRLGSPLLCGAGQRRQRGAGQRRQQQQQRRRRRQQQQ
jgi:hypothetical protein